MEEHATRIVQISAPTDETVTRHPGQPAPHLKVQKLGPLHRNQELAHSKSLDEEGAKPARRFPPERELLFLPPNSTTTFSERSSPLPPRLVSGSLLTHALCFDTHTANKMLDEVELPGQPAHEKGEKDSGDDVVFRGDEGGELICAGSDGEA